MLTNKFPKLITDFHFNNLLNVNVSILSQIKIQNYHISDTFIGDKTITK